MTGLALALLLAVAPPDRVPAFPGAEGFGAFTKGGRGGRVIPVTTLKDSGRGSLRAAVEAKGPRIVVFRVAGVIELKSNLSVRNSHLTLAGQTAPGDGICIKGYGFLIRADEVIVRHLRFRPGDVARKEVDSLSVYRARNVIIDHCSASWSIDEVLSVTGEGCTNVTVQWCFITESLNKSYHHKGEHGYGSLIRTDGDVTYHHNLYAHHRTRCPRPGTVGKKRGIVLDFRNNVIYDWGSPAGYTSEDRATINYVGNYLKRGPSTTDRDRIFNIGGDSTRMFVARNRLEGAEEGNEDNWRLIDDAKDMHRSGKPFPAAAVRTHDAKDAYEEVLKGAGATLPSRDAVDHRVAGEVREGKGRIIDSQKDVGGWPRYRSGDSPADGDGDGMTDAWEKKHGLDPRSDKDAGRDGDGDGYSNLEEYLNGTDPARK